MKLRKLLGLGIILVGLASCDSAKDTVETKNAGGNLNQNINAEKGLSSLDYNLEKEFFYDDYNTRSLADETRQGIKTFENKEDIVFDQVTYEELVHIFQSEGNYLVLFGGSWCHKTRAAVPFINAYAKEYNIDKIYNFDFYLDGTNSSTHIRNTNQTDPSKITAGVEYNFLYGELVSKYLTNLNDYVEYKIGSQSSLTYTNNEYK